ncbi:hypothetical protein HK098_004541 [Nowakowskiella sp. JEL0407]|nr:hypothetical protein HK098_004541 [Nowakowskiella sp. JEL0407]
MTPKRVPPPLPPKPKVPILITQDSNDEIKIEGDNIQISSPQPPSKLRRKNPNLTAQLSLDTLNLKKMNNLHVYGDNGCSPSDQEIKSAGFVSDSGKPVIGRRASSPGIDVFQPCDAVIAKLPKKKSLPSRTNKRNTNTFTSLDELSAPTEKFSELKPSTKDNASTGKGFRRPWQAAKELNAKIGSSLSKDKSVSQNLLLDKREIFLENGVSILDISPRDIARHFAGIHSELFQQIRRSEFESMAWSGPEKMQKSSNIVAMTQHFNKIVFWVCREILDACVLKRRFQKICHFIGVAKHSYELRDFHGLRSIIAGLQSTPVHRLERTWAMIGRREKAVFDKLCELFSPVTNSDGYRKRLLHCKTPVVPYIEALKKEIRENRSFYIKERQLQIELLLDNIQRLQNTSIYNVDVNPILYETIQNFKYDPETHSVVEESLYWASYQLEPKSSPTSITMNQSITSPKKSINHVSPTSSQSPRKLSSPTTDASFVSKTPTLSKISGGESHKDLLGHSSNIELHQLRRKSLSTGVLLLPKQSSSSEDADLLRFNSQEKEVMQLIPSHSDMYRICAIDDNDNTEEIMFSSENISADSIEVEIERKYSSPTVLKAMNMNLNDEKSDIYSDIDTQEPPHQESFATMEKGKSRTLPNPKKSSLFSMSSTTSQSAAIDSDNISSFGDKEISEVSLVTFDVKSTTLPNPPKKLPSEGKSSQKSISFSIESKEHLYSSEIKERVPSQFVITDLDSDFADENIKELDFVDIPTPQPSKKWPFFKSNTNAISPTQNKRPLQSEEFKRQLLHQTERIFKAKRNSNNTPQIDTERPLQSEEFKRQLRQQTEKRREKLEKTNKLATLAKNVLSVKISGKQSLQNNSTPNISSPLSGSSTLSMKETPTFAKSPEPSSASSTSPNKYTDVTLHRPSQLKSQHRKQTSDSETSTKNRTSVISNVSTDQKVLIKAVSNNKITPRQRSYTDSNNSSNHSLPRIPTLQTPEKEIEYEKNHHQLKKQMVLQAILRKKEIEVNFSDRSTTKKRKRKWEQVWAIFEGNCIKFYPYDGANVIFDTNSRSKNSSFENEQEESVVNKSNNLSTAKKALAKSLDLLSSPKNRLIGSSSNDNNSTQEIASPTHKLNVQQSNNQQKPKTMSKGKFIPNEVGTLILTSTTTIEVVSNATTKEQNVFRIFSSIIGSTESISTLLQASTNAEMNRWVSAIQAELDSIYRAEDFDLFD